MSHANPNISMNFQPGQSNSMRLLGFGKLIPTYGLLSSQWAECRNSIYITLIIMCAIGF